MKSKSPVSMFYTHPTQLIAGTRLVDNESRLFIARRPRPATVCLEDEHGCIYIWDHIAGAFMATSPRCCEINIFPFAFSLSEKNPQILSYYHMSVSSTEPNNLHRVQKPSTDIVADAPDP